MKIRQIPRQVDRFSVLLVVLSGLSGCVSRPMLYENPGLRARFEKEFASRSLDPIEGFWQSKNEYTEVIGVAYRVEPSTNAGFPFAVRAIHEKRNVALPYPLLGNRVAARWKPSSESGVYHGQVLMFRGNRSFWENAVLKLLDPTTVEATVHTQGSVLGGNTQRGYYVGPEKELKARLAMNKGSKVFAQSGSGFLVSPTLVVTNYHVVSGMRSIRCMVNRIEIEAELIARDQDNDLALLRLSEPVPKIITPLRIGDSAKVHQGQTVYAMGYPLTDVLGEDMRVHTGIVSSLTGYQGSSSQFQVQMSVHPGDSGGPLLNNRGDVLGIITSKLGLRYMLKSGDIPEGITFAMKANRIRGMASAAKVYDDLTFASDEESTMNLKNLVAAFGNSVVQVRANM